MNTNNNRDAQLTEDIMRRVHFIHAVRLLLSPAIVRAVVLVASIATTIVLVSIPHCLANMSHLQNMSAYFSYTMNAYMHTNLTVQVAVTLAFAALLWMIGDAIRNFRYGRLLNFRQA